jgi:YYY domain-containing protein
MGNLGTARMIYDGLKQMGTPEGETFSRETTGPLEAMRGLGRLLTLNGQIPYALHHWYWNPSRAIRAPEGETDPITEFPYFTFLYADLHAHMIALPLTATALGWSLGLLMGAESRRPRRIPEWAAALFLGALLLGALGPTNTWDYPVYWALGAAAAATAVLLARGRLTVGSVVEAGLTAGLLLITAQLLYRPYHAWYGQGYTEIDLWKGSKTALGDYLTVHGLFLYLIVPWLIWETRQWMAATPLSELARLRPRFGTLGLFAALGVMLVAFLAAAGYRVAPLVSVLVVWAGLLLLRPGLPIEKRAALVMTASAAALTLLVEVVVLVGDIARMNTVFKFYLQVWTLFSLASAGALAWTLADLPLWGPRARQVWASGLALLAFAASLYPATATGAKVRDRMTIDAPNTLDGAAFMLTADYQDLAGSFDLAHDYAAIQWVQEHISGSPVIVEAQIPEYRWGSRFAIYTGLPAVLGWNWHQRQQRAAVADLDVSQRAREITDFYLTQSAEQAQQFLDRYQVRYVVVGELERMYYGELDQCTGDGLAVSCSLAGRLEGFVTLPIPPDRCTPNGGSGLLNCPTGGLEKFERMAGLGLLRPVYQQGGTTIYEVIG